MNRSLILGLIVYGVIVTSEVQGATIKGAAFDLSPTPRARTNRNVPIFVTGIGLNALNQPFVIPLPVSKLRKDGKFEIVISDTNVRAISLFFQGSQDGLQDIQVDRLLNKDQTIDVALPDAEPKYHYYVVPQCVNVVPTPYTRRRFFHH